MILLRASHPPARVTTLIVPLKIKQDECVVSMASAMTQVIAEAPHEA